MLTSATRYQAINVPLQPWQARLSDLLERMARRELSALTAFYEQTHRQVFGLLLMLLPERSTAETVLSEVYEHVWQQAGCVPHTTDSPLTWLMLLARQLGLERAQAMPQQRTTPTLLSINPAAEPAHKADHNTNSEISARRQIMQQAIRRLPIEQHQALELACFAGLTYTEIAHQLGRAPAEIKTQLVVGMRTLRTQLPPQL